ncbi:MAG: GntG family PLP-dependent aldolase [Armatimonadota bacterium]|nr:GntG family PLP-dependent aldolase [Armatimonadota bacterium]
MINLRSDTQTLPTESMLRAITSAPLGDDVFGEDPTVRKLEDMAARMLGKEAGLLVVSGTMGNLVSLMAHSNRGDEVILDPDSHIFYHETGSLAAIAGLMPMPVRSREGMLDPDDVAAAIRSPNVHYPRPRILCLENTHNRSGGRILPLDLHKRLCAIAHERGLKVHLDGARIFNAQVASGIPASEWAREADSVMFCLSKGLSCPIGSVVVGDAEFIERARRFRKQIGGGMRQAGVIAACGIVALETMIDRLAEDHINAKLLAQGLADIAGLKVDPDKVETNMVYAEHSATGLSTEELLTRLKEQGVLASGSPPNRIRFVTHRHIDRSAVEEAICRIKRAVEGA